MVVGLGVDLVELDRVKLSYGRWGERLVARLMDPFEASLLPEAAGRRAEAIAFAIAAKEAASKALGTGWSQGVRWRDVVVSAGPPPAVRLLARAAEIARRRGSTGETRTRVEVRGNFVIGRVMLLG